LLTEQGAKMQKTVDELKNARLQLTQKEKTASLGEFAAGIAREIHDPLSSVIKHSETGIDLTTDLKRQLSTGNIPEDQQLKLNSIADQLMKNQQKIIDDGYQAEEIVKGMLPRSRKTSGEDDVLT